MLSFSDQQMATGIAIIAAGLTQINNIDRYHWQLIVYLGWMSSNVHLTTLTLLQHYFHERPLLSGLRVVGMLILFALLLFGLFPSGQFLFNENIPVKCLWEPRFAQRGEFGAAVVVSYVILCCSYMWKISSLVFSKRFYPGVQQWIWCRFERKFALLAQSKRQRQTLSWKLSLTLTILLYLVTIALLDMSQSFAASLWTLIIGVFWGTIRIITFKAFASPPGENVWTFGQTLPLLLMLLPLTMLVERVSDRSHLKGAMSREKRPREVVHAVFPTVFEEKAEKSEQTHVQIRRVDTGSSFSTESDVGNEAQFDFNQSTYLSEYLLGRYEKTSSYTKINHDIVSHCFLYKSRYFCAFQVATMVSIVVATSSWIWLCPLAPGGGPSEYMIFSLPIIALAVIIPMLICAGPCFSSLFNMPRRRRRPSGLSTIPDDSFKLSPQYEKHASFPIKP